MFVQRLSGVLGMLSSYGTPSVWRWYSAIHEELPRQDVKRANEGECYIISRRPGFRHLSSRKNWSKTRTNSSARDRFICHRNIVCCPKSPDWSFVEISSSQRESSPCLRWIFAFKQAFCLCIYLILAITIRGGEICGFVCSVNPLRISVVERIESKCLFVYIGWEYCVSRDLSLILHRRKYCPIIIYLWEFSHLTYASPFCHFICRRCFADSRSKSAQELRE